MRKWRQDILTVTDLAEICSASEQTIKDLINDGKIPAYKVARGIWLTSLEQFIQHIETQSDTIPDNLTQSSIKDFDR